MIQFQWAIVPGSWIQLEAEDEMEQWLTKFPQVTVSPPYWQVGALIAVMIGLSTVDAQVLTNTS